MFQRRIGRLEVDGCKPKSARRVYVDQVVVKKHYLVRPVVESIEENDYAISQSFALRLLNSNNRIEIYDPAKDKQDSIDFLYYNPTQYTSYPGSIGIDNGSIGDNDNAFVALGDQNPYLSYATSKKSFSGNYTLFFQQLTVTNENKRRFQHAILYPTAPDKPGSTKNVNRTIFSKDGIKLRVYYTKPTVPLN